jgi:predicted ArsR family transcriptional regulator
MPSRNDVAPDAGFVKGGLANIVHGVVTDAQRRLVDRLHRLPGSTAGELAGALGLTAAAVRLHLDRLVALGLATADAAAVETGVARARGRPAQRWRLTETARALYPDRHADLAVELLSLLRDELGEDALERVVAGRVRRQASTYAGELDQVGTDVGRRARRLAELRSAEGYEAEVVVAADGDGVLLIEHHCPVCDAATTCQGLCRGELQAFQSAMGPDADVEREQHLLSGDDRCTYRIRTRR